MCIPVTNPLELNTLLFKDLDSATFVITRQRRGFSHLRYHKFKHGVLAAGDPLCSCSSAIENTIHYFLNCPNFSTAQNTFLNEIVIVNKSLIDKTKSWYIVVIQLILSMITNQFLMQVNQNI